MNNEHTHYRVTTHQLARLALFSFVITFLAARAVVFLIMSHQIPNMYCFVHGTHIHHLNYGIFLLTAVAGYGIFRRPNGRAANVAAVLYGVAVALTFDEFGMWLNLGGGYWQRASVDVVMIIAALLALVGFAQSLERFEKHHLWLSIILGLALIGFGVVLFSANHQLHEIVGTKLHELEISSSP
jgi:hypothetical protein